MPAVFILFLCISFGGGCATFSLRPPGIIETNEKMVAGCKFLGTVAGSSALGWLVEEGALERAEIEALHKAVAMGATHIIWTQIESKEWSQRVAARAYKCK